MYKMMIRGTDKEFNVGDEIYPFMERDQFTGMPTIYNRVVVVDEDNNPEQFLVVMPTDVVYKRYPYDQDEMDTLLEAAEAARIQFDERAQQEKESRLEKAELESQGEQMPPMTEEDMSGYH